MEIKINLKGIATYYSFEEFAKEMYLYPSQSFTMIKSKKFLKILYNYDEKMYNKIVGLLREPFQQDALLFKVQYILNPLMSLRHHGYEFSTLEELGKRIINFAPDVDIYLKDFLKYELLSHYMRITKYDEKEPVLYKRILALEEEFIKNENRAYFKLGIILEGTNKIYYGRKEFDSIKKFLSYIIRPVYITDFASNFIKSQYIFAYLEENGYDKEIILWENLINSVEQKEKKNDNIRKV